MKTSFRLFFLLTALTILPIQASEADSSAPSAEPVYETQVLELEGHLHELKTRAENGDAAAMQQLYMRYAVHGHMEQAQAWSDRYMAALKEQAGSGDPRAMLTLGMNYLTGKDLVKPDTAQAVTWLLRAADAGEPSAAYILADVYAQQGDAEMSRQAYERAYSAYRKLAEEKPDNSNIIYWLGYMQQNGLGTEANAHAGIDLLEKAAELGNPWAYAQLFKTYMQGIGTARDEARAIGYARKIADSGQDALMAYATAIAYLNGEGVEKNEELGAKYLDMAAAANIPDAIFLKGRRLQLAGKTTEALPLYQQAASMGQEDALIELALMLLYGNGVEKDESRGLSYLQTANHRMNSPRAPYELARYYESIGEQSLADDWYVSASEAGLLEAMARRGLLHLNPFSKMSWDPTVAYQWWRTGSDKGDATCTLYLRLFLYVFCPLLLIIVFGLPMFTVRYLGRKARQEMQEELREARKNP